MKLKTISANDYEMAYIDCGNGVPLVFVHGSLSDYRYWGNQVDFFNKKYRTIVLSLRHCYPESWNGEGGDFSIRQHVDDLAVFIRNLNVAPVHMVGHSRGGSVVLKMVADHPHLIRTAILADPAPFNTMLLVDSEAAEEINKRKEVVIKALDLINKGALDRGLEVFTDSVSLPGTWKKLSGAAKQIRRDNAWSLKSLIKDSLEQFSCKDAMKIDKPVLLITGENSPCLYGMMHAKLEGSLKSHQKVIIKNASHGVHRDNPKDFNGCVLDFLNKNSF